jgi:penicillin amidase
MMDKDRAEPLIFEAFLSALHRILLVEKTGVDLDDEGPFDATTLISLIKDHPSWCDAPGKPDPDCRMTLTRALDEGLAQLVKRDGADTSKWAWGNEHVALLRHKVYSHIPLLDRISDLSMPSSGDFYTLDRGGGFNNAPPDMPFARTQGGGFRGLYDLADPDKSRFMIATGQSGHIFSPHYRDLLPLWIDVKSIPLAGTEAELQKAGAKKLTFTPK